jgi:hypothetical protein
MRRFRFSAHFLEKLFGSLFGKGSVGGDLRRVAAEIHDGKLAHLADRLAGFVERRTAATELFAGVQPPAYEFAVRAI